MSIADVLKRRKKNNRTPDQVILDELKVLKDDVEDIKKKTITQFQLELDGKDFSHIKGDKGEDGRDGRDGKDGKKGKDGIDGQDGLDGKDGKKGGVGKRGEDGKDGKQGDSGTDGIDGSPDNPIDIVEKLNTLEGVVEQDVIKGLKPTIRSLEQRIQEAQSKGGGGGGGGGGSDNFTNISSSSNIITNSKINLVNASSADITVTLPPASQAARREYHIKKVDSSENTVTIATRGSETIDGETTVVISTQYTSCRLYSDSKKYHII